MNHQTQFKPIPDGVKTPKMLEVERRIGATLEHDYSVYYLHGTIGQKRLANRWGVPRALIFGPLAGRRRSWTQRLCLAKKQKPSAPDRRENAARGCEICRNTHVPPESAHWIAKRDGGTSTPFNILKLCPNCHTLLHHGDENTTRRACEILVWRAAESFVSRPERGAQVEQQFLEICTSVMRSRPLEFAPQPTGTCDTMRRQHTLTATACAARSMREPGTPPQE
jgi:hypothetical protein